MTDTITAGYSVKDRVQIHPATDRWTRGDRYGEIERVTKTRLHVRMDRSKQLVTFHPDNILEII